MPGRRNQPRPCCWPCVEPVREVRTLHRDESVTTPQRRHPESRPRRFLRTYRFEIIWLVIVVIGVFLIFERLNIRGVLSAWLGRVSVVTLGGVDRLGDQIDAFLTRITLSDAIGFVLVMGALVAIALRVRWRLLHNPALALLRCPQCDGNIHRVHRHAVDRAISLYVPVRRYRCSSDSCRWHGLRVGVDHGSNRASARKSS
jgi:hypothetical protein